MIVSFTVLGVPVGKGRPRFVRRGAHVGTYTPAKTATYEASIREAAAGTMGDRAPADGPVELRVMAQFPFPKSWSAKRRAASKGCHTSKPDLDNIVKLVGDALNGVAFKDDSQVVTVHASKCYGHPEGSITVEVY